MMRTGTKDAQVAVEAGVNNCTQTHHIGNHPLLSDSGRMPCRVVDPRPPVFVMVTEPGVRATELLKRGILATVAQHVAYGSSSSAHSLHGPATEAWQSELDHTESPAPLALVQAEDLPMPVGERKSY